ncbi:MAG: META domain-containing protein [Candidatus Electrothrix sp. AR4]|nr:META domain-containing protein [Candidatus Electrothrix sp. AR4]
MLHDDDWVLQTLNDQSVLPEAPPITLKFGAEGRLTGSAGCNSYMGNYTYTALEHGIKIDSISRTAKLCNPTEIMEQERRFVDALTTATSYMIEDDRLELQISDGSSALVFIED